MHVSCHAVSLLTLTQVMYNLWREIRKIQLMKCPLNFDCTTRQKHLGNPNLKHDTSWLLPKWNLQVLMCISEIKNEVLYSYAKILWHILCFRWSGRELLNISLLAKQGLKTKLKILFFFSKLVILKRIYGRLIINRFSSFSPFVLSFSSFSLVDAETSGYFQDCEFLVPILYRFSKLQHPICSARWGGGEFKRISSLKVLSNFPILEPIGLAFNEIPLNCSLTINSHWSRNSLLEILASMDFWVGFPLYDCWICYHD
mgnify:CR=1 FL=1